MADRLVRFVTDDSRSPRPSSSLAILCATQVPVGLLDAATKLVQTHDIINEVDVGAVHQAALTKGVAVETGAAESFLKTARRLWLPDSPRSRLQGSDASDPPLSSRSS